MIRVKYDDLLKEFKRVLESRGFSAKAAEDAATVFAQNSLDGIYSHGINRFPRVVEYLDKGEIDFSFKCYDKKKVVEEKIALPDDVVQEP